VWYTPNEIVDYMVARVDHVLRAELGVADGLASEEVVLLDPCCGTGAYLVAVMNRIYDYHRANGEDARTAAIRAREAAQTRLFGFEIMPAPFAIAHLQLNLLLTRWGAPLETAKNQRAGVYLTNALTGWGADEAPQQLYLRGLERERDAANRVKRGRKVMVVIGNPPYNAYAGTSPDEEGDLVEPYKHGLRDIWGIRKYNLDELYVRFFRLAERCIAELNADGRGVVCYISNFSYLNDPSFVVMRQRFLSEFDKLWFDSLNGDSRETGKRIPKGLPGAGNADPSVFSTEFNREGIRVGTAVGLMARTRRGPRGASEATGEGAIVAYRDFWGANKRDALIDSLKAADFNAQYALARPARHNRYALRPSVVAAQYLTWPKLTELCAVAPMNGLMEKRGGALIDIDRPALERRMRAYYDPALTWEAYKALDYGLTEPQSGFDPIAARAKVMNKEQFNESRVVRYAVRPFDTRWAYYTSINPIWNRSRPDLWAQHWPGNQFLMSRRIGGGEDEGVPFFWSRIIADDHLLKVDASLFPIMLRQAHPPEEGAQPALFGADKPLVRANLSTLARDYLAGLGFPDPDGDPQIAALLWLHALAIGYAPEYLADHADGLKSDWPRIPLPTDAGRLRHSADLGAQAAALLDSERDVPGVTSGMIRPELRDIAVLRVRDGNTPGGAPDLAVRAGWGHLSQGAVMPGRGKTVPSVASGAAGEPERLDICLNDTTCWSGVPVAVWEYTIGGYQVLKKWLSYREEAVLGRPLREDNALNEVREFQLTARRLAALLGLHDALDENYRACVETGVASEEG
jgi:hypothetical protein